MLRKSARFLKVKVEAKAKAEVKGFDTIDE
jgi:hypothetical protein